MAAMEARRYEEACPAIEESYKLDPRPGTLFTLAECEAGWGRIATAVRRYDDYLTLYAALTPEKQKKQGEREQIAREQKAKLSPLVPELTLNMPPGAPRGTIVTRDGAPVAESALGVPMPVDPGEHVIVVQAPGGTASEQRVTIEKGDKKGLLLEIRVLPLPDPQATIPPAPAPAPPDPGGPNGQRVAAWATGSVGLAALVVGAVTGGLAIAAKGTIDQNCGSGIGQPISTACNPTGKDAADRLKALGLGSTVGFVVGIAGLGTSVVLFVTAPKAQPSGAAGTGIALRGTW